MDSLFPPPDDMELRGFERLVELIPLFTYTTPRYKSAKVFYRQVAQAIWEALPNANPFTLIYRLSSGSSRSTTLLHAQPEPLVVRSGRWSARAYFQHNLDDDTLVVLVEFEYQRSTTTNPVDEFEVPF